MKNYFGEVPRPLFIAVPLNCAWAAIGIRVRPVIRAGAGNVRSAGNPCSASRHARTPPTMHAGLGLGLGPGLGLGLGVGLGLALGPGLGSELGLDL